MIMQTLRQFSTRVNASTSPVHYKYIEIGQQPVTLHLAWCDTKDTFSIKRFLLTFLFTLCLFASNPLQIKAQEFYADLGASILIFPYYYADISTTSPINTQISITNIHPSESRYVKIFYRAQQAVTYGSLIEKIQLHSAGTFTRDMRNYDPLLVGSIFAVVVDANDVPLKANDIIGVASIGRYGNNSTVIRSLVSAYEVRRISSTAKTPVSGSCTLTFDGVDYAKLPGQVIGTPAGAISTQSSVTVLAMPDRLAQSIVSDTALRFPNVFYRGSFAQNGQTCGYIPSSSLGYSDLFYSQAGPHNLGLGWSVSSYVNGGPGYSNSGIDWTKRSSQKSKKLIIQA